MASASGWGRSRSIIFQQAVEPSLAMFARAPLAMSTVSVSLRVRGRYASAAGDAHDGIDTLYY